MCTIPFYGRMELTGPLWRQGHRAVESSVICVSASFSLTPAFISPRSSWSHQAWQCRFTPLVACIQHVDDFRIPAEGNKQKHNIHAILGRSWKSPRGTNSRMGLASEFGVELERRNLVFLWVTCILLIYNNGFIDKSAKEWIIRIGTGKTVVDIISKSSLHQCSELHVTKLHAASNHDTIHGSYISVKMQRSLGKKYCSSEQKKGIWVNASGHNSFTSQYLLNIYIYFGICRLCIINGEIKKVGRARLSWEHLSGLNFQPTNLNGKVLSVIGVVSSDILTQKIGSFQKKKIVFWQY
jgi:hypothetical protein